MNSINIGDGKVEIVNGDITSQETEAIVDAANNYLWMGSGVAGAIKAKGGAEIETEAIAQGEIEIGASVITSAGNLKAKYVIHAAAMGQDLSTDADKIEKATASAFTLAEEKRISSISMPALGTGVGGFRVDACADIMLKASIEFLQNSNHLKLIRFVLFGEEDYLVFESRLKIIFSA